MSEELPAPTFWVAAPPRPGLVLSGSKPSEWESHPIYTADQMRAAIQQERERCAKLC